jgi:hypothetical protein
VPTEDNLTSVGCQGGHPLHPRAPLKSKPIVPTLESTRCRHRIPRTPTIIKLDADSHPHSSSAPGLLLLHRTALHTWTRLLLYIAWWICGSSSTSSLPSSAHASSTRPAPSSAHPVGLPSKADGHPRQARLRSRPAPVCTPLTPPAARQPKANGS